MRYTTPESVGGTTFAYRLSITQAGYRYYGTLEGKPFSLLITPGECSDGMSDMVYPYTATLKIGDRTEQGCAKKL